MKPEITEWVEKAEGDIYTARRELAAKRHQNYDAVCFHAQQCVEKYLKASLIEAEITFPKTHDVEDLLNRALALDSTWDQFRGEIQQLASMAVEVRYPGMMADQEDAGLALKTAEKMRAVIRKSLGIHDGEI
jgi:HEPN domain-containing protein